MSSCSGEISVNQLIAVRAPPTHTIKLLREGQPSLPALKEAMAQYTALLRPYVGVGKQHGN
jgi:hypothetical protein